MQFGPDFLVDVLATYSNPAAEHRRVHRHRARSLRCRPGTRRDYRPRGAPAIQVRRDDGRRRVELPPTRRRVARRRRRGQRRRLPGAFAGSALIAARVTLAVGLSAQDVLRNFVAGAFLVQDPDVNIGDRIRWEDEEGIIIGIDLRVTRVRTLDNEIIVVPNSELSTTVVRNLTSHDPVGFPTSSQSSTTNSTRPSRPSGPSQTSTTNSSRRRRRLSG